MATCFAALAAVLLVGCERRTADRAEQIPATPPTSSAMESTKAAPFTPRPKVEVQSAPETPARTSTPAEIGNRLRVATEPSERSEFVAELWELNTPEAIEILRQQFFVERDPDVRADILSGVVDDPKPATREGRFSLLSAALAPNQPADVRSIAVNLLADYDDPRAVALLQNLIQDPNEDVREAAKDAIETQREKNAK